MWRTGGDFFYPRREVAFPYGEGGTGKARDG